MRKLDFDEYKLCQMQGNLFEMSVDLAHFSSPMFIRRFMMNDIAKSYINKTHLLSTASERKIITELNETYKESAKSPLYSKEEMYWIGYIYAALCFLYDLQPKVIYKCFPGQVIRNYYGIYHTFDIEQAAERIMESVSYQERNLQEEALVLLRQLFELNKLREKIGQNIKVIVDKPIGYKDEKEGILYTLNYGYVENLKTKKGEKIEAYILDEKEPLETYEGKVQGILSNLKENRSVFLVSNNEDITGVEIRKAIAFKEKRNKYKIIRKQSKI